MDFAVVWFFRPIVLVCGCLFNGHRFGPDIIYEKSYFLEGISYTCLVLWANHKMILY